MIYVPDIVGLSEAEAESAILAAGLLIGEITDDYSDTVPDGDVISQAPTADAEVAKGTAVDFVVSMGIESPMISVPGGSFSMGDLFGDGDPSELPVHTVTLSAYQIGKWHVTNQEYADMLNWAYTQGYLTTASTTTADAYGVQLLDVDDSNSQISWDGAQFVVNDRESYSMAEHPALVVSWYGAAVYCNWLSEYQDLEPCYNTTTWVCDFTKNGYHLPTEAQWERAAAWDGSYHYRYGNGSDSISADMANFYGVNPLALVSEPHASPVGYYSDVMSPAGCFDMCGNVLDWCNDWYDSRYYQSSPETDPPGPATGTYRVLRGGSWLHASTYCRSSVRLYNDPWNTGRVNGFRLAR